MFRELTRKNKQLPVQDCIGVLKTQTRGVLSVIGDDGYPYGMPMNHWYDDRDGCLYFHTGNEGGHRLDSLQKCDKVSFCVYDEGYCKKGDWARNVQSVIVFGGSGLWMIRALSLISQHGSAINLRRMKRISKRRLSSMRIERCFSDLRRSISAEKW